MWCLVAFRCASVRIRNLQLMMVATIVLLEVVGEGHHAHGMRASRPYLRCTLAFE
ncbi:hypothetical protein BKA66DRAFT_462695 [Pyrenochaeta sp. MPI-SDFR-AT-0127]|nr:hypothetical protein BKA66DRAFT_462695 [Pyrenochaeta sp. MPI-SDFR-AT-0127]